MDELLHHCLRELSFDGDLGCDVSRLRDFIVEFYTHGHASHRQTVDDALYAFVWSVVVQNPTVCIGTIPPGVATEVYIASQTSAKRKAKAKGEEHVDGLSPTLNILPDAKLRSLHDLKKEYGDNLRIAVDRETSFAAITGSHIRSSKLSPMVYTALQFITRGRENGISVIDLGRKSGYDQKTCFYLVKQLVELGQIVKVRRGGVGTHFCIHNYFYERNPLWKQIRDEELQADQDFQKRSPEYQPPTEDQNGVGDSESAPVDFDPIDARHLSSLPLVRARVIKLLKGSKNHMHPCHNMLLTIGFSNPTKTDRRFFQSRIRELIQQGLIERVIVPHNKKKDLNSTIKCFRLVNSEDRDDGGEDGVIVEPQLIIDEEKDDGVLDDQGGVKTNLTILKQIIDLLEEAGTTGMTLSELSAALCHFDKRTIELLLTRAERVPPPSHLSDLGIAGLMETHGRERRNRYFTIASYRTLVARENLDESTAAYFDVDLNNVGGFAAIDPSMFYKDEEMLFKYQDEFKEQERAKVGGKPRKHPLKNPILPDGTVKQGRPKGSTKMKKREDAEVQPGTKRKRDDSLRASADDGPHNQKGGPAKKRRFNLENTGGLPAGAAVEPNKEPDIAARHSQVDCATEPEGDEITKQVTSDFESHPPKNRRSASGKAGQVSGPKKRGRPPKEKSEAGKEGADMVGRSVPLPKKRGRPPKQKPVPSKDVEGEEVVDHLEVDDGDTQTRGRSSKQKIIAHGKQSVEDYGPTQSLHEGQPKKRARLEQEDSHSRPFEAETTTVFRSENLHEGDWPNVPHQSVNCSPHSGDSAEHHPKAMGRGNAGGDTSQGGSSETNPSLTVLTSGINIESPGLPAAREDLITQGALNSEFDNIRRQAPIVIDPSLTMGEAGDVYMGVSGASLSHAMGPEVSDLPTFANLISQAEHPFTKGVISSTPNDQPLTTQPEDQTNITPRPRVNVSNLRRENELLRVIEDLGGIVNYHTKEFFDAHSMLIKTMIKSGEPTSAPPDVRLDKRTASSTLTNMENRGRVKTLKTSVTTPTGLSRPACIVYFPNIAQDKINAYLGSLTCGNVTALPQAIKKIDKRMEYGPEYRPDGDPTERNSLPLQLLEMERSGDDRRRHRNKDVAKANQLFSYDDATIRSVLLTEKTTLSQLYGFIVSKALRARELHLSMISALETDTASLNIVSLQHRIVHFSYFSQDLALATYCAVVSALNYSEELNDFLATEPGPQTPIRGIPYNLYNTVLRIGRSRARSRLLDVLEILRSLKLVTPLRPSNSSTPLITCAKNEEHPTAFDTASIEGWTVNAPVYWRFNADAPLHLWALSETSPPFCKDVSVSSRTDAEAYWRELRETCTNRDYPQLNADSNAESVMGPLNASIAAARSLRRAVSWSDGYILTWHQRQYLMRFVDTSTGNTPLQSDAGRAQMQNICWVISAPMVAVTNFFMQAGTKMLRVLDRARRRKKRHSADDQAKDTTEAKALLLKKAAEAKTQREKDWDDIILRVHAEPLVGPVSVRVRRVRSRFLQSSSTKDVRRWESEITEAIWEATMPATKALKATARPLPPVAPPPVMVNPPEKSIESLMAQQGPPLLRQPRSKRKKSSKDTDNHQESAVETPKTVSLRRHRFMWNREYDELARDASAIIRARCRDGPRLDWGAFEQVFPAIPRNSVRQRLAHIRETPGNEAYLDRLEDRWYELWIQHRGTTHLPDEDPQSLSKFSLIKHIEFLRTHIDKNALRVGFGLPKDYAGANLPISVDELVKNCDILESLPVTPEFDFMWSATVEDGREKNLLRQAITTHIDDFSITAHLSSELEYVAESAVKMTFGTPHESYNSDAAARLLRDLGEHVVSTATGTLVNRGVLSKTVRDPQKSKPGRTLKISELNQNAIGGSIPRDTFQDAATLEDISSQQEEFWREWPLLATEGDLVTLLQLVSDHKVEFKIDTSQPQSARPSLDWNSKKADDDQIETAIFVQFHDLSTPGLPAPMGEFSSALIQIEGESTLGHGQSVDDGPACCRRDCDGLVDCHACLEDEYSNFTTNLNKDERELALRILTNVRAAESKGVAKNDLLNMHASSESIYSLVCRMTDTSIPLVFWSGYSSIVLVSSLYLRAWTVITSETPRTRIFPRRWFDIAGLKMNDIWEAALKAVVGVVLFRPGISQAELRWRLRSVYDRQEVHDIICHLQQQGFIKSRHDPSLQPAPQDDTSAMIMLDDWEEKMTFWFIGDVKSWYQV